MNRKKIATLILSVVCVTGVLFTGCEDMQSTDDKQAQQTEVLQKQAAQKLGMPNITNFYEKKTLKRIMEDCDNSNLITYAYIYNTMTGKFEYLGQTIGYGIPYGTEYTNPQYKPNGYNEEEPLPQADPNGLYKAENVSATWLMLIDPSTGEAKPVYEESEITVSPFKLDKSKCDPTSLPSDY